MKIGTSTDVIRHLGLDEKLKLISDIGYDVAEVWMGDIHNSNLTARETKAILDRYDLGYTIHADIRDVNLTSSNKGIAAESLRQMLETLAFAKEVGISVVTMHPGRVSSTKDDAEDFWQSQTEAFQKIAAEAHKLEVFVGIENMELRKKEFVVDYASVERLMVAVANPYMGFTLDIAHARTLTADVAGYVQGVAVPIVNVHASQAVEQKAHLPFYAERDGLIDLGTVVEELAAKRYSGAIINESYDKRDPMRALEKAYEYLKEAVGELS